MHLHSSPQPDLTEIGRALDLLLEPGQVAELRVLHTRRGTVSGYFSDIEKLAQVAAQLSGQGPGVYFSLNPGNPDLLARANNHVREYAKETTSDRDILRRRLLPIDFDAKRPAGISSTNAEHDAALDRAFQCREHLRAEDWPEPIMADSGNGGHLVYRIDLPNNDESRQMISGALKALALRFDDDVVQVDIGNFNAARIWKIYGTAVCKGDSIPTRPHRLARILEAPDRLAEVFPSPLDALAAQAPQPPQAPMHGAYRGRGEPFGMEMWIAEHNLQVAFRGAWNGGTKWILTTCLWNAEHTNGSAYIVRFPNGAIVAGCHHNSCQGRGWADLREAAEPGYRARRSTGAHHHRRNVVFEVRG